MKIYNASSPLQASCKGDFSLQNLSSSFPDATDKKRQEKGLKKETKKLDLLQQKLYAQDSHSILCVFQAIDAAGKDSTIRSVFGRLNPAGFQVHSFKAPSKEELDHDFLWRTASRLPERGRIGIFNRSYYEETLVVKVHPEYLSSQRLDAEVNDDFWQQRYKSIRTHEEHLVANGTVVLKFWLNVSKAEQKQRFLSRLERPEKHWKFSANDLVERGYWEDYMAAYEDCIRHTSTEYAPWYVIPADDKPAMRHEVARIVRRTLEKMDPQFPQLDADDIENLSSYANQLNSEK
ncbi:MAG: PPK2 family polyphosphate kinase [Pseudomonadales bacterium]